MSEIRPFFSFLSIHFKKVGKGREKEGMFGLARVYKRERGGRETGKREEGKEGGERVEGGSS